jgi:molybdenum cofactor cytidylyltransferase
MPIPAIVLAAGASRRLGRPKQLVRIEGEPLLERTFRVTRQAGAWPIFVVLGAHRDAILAAVDLDGATVVVNEEWEQGIAASIHAGVRAVQANVYDAAGVLMLVCDQTRLSAEHLAALIAGFESASSQTILASQYAGMAGIPAVFPASQFDALLALRGDTGARALLRKSECPVALVPFEDGEFDLDSTVDLERIL